ncbi:hypothetical protein TBLA_0C05210 [Henningerozyma blattae CBS 6284]|uniref:Uncharacterized protein n=1 Tax=Henningerozyma blattae (strain ATCC 34711 / CBS 6284 / DSM 70876 / NBRC 10599 / NRRL Y-10934 / UCD 77-7) TaxID=1071380 RepID=I2H1R5_HENB6|nr:hypothetical protein TBLA_0C05210 [Tetrapisispora blattae CBS 6284]CCH60317.1 hypothetical protein TBLA_0C05210 [Tetrapisispora blattae CBS 6284]
MALESQWATASNDDIKSLPFMKAKNQNSPKKKSPSKRFVNNNNKTNTFTPTHSRSNSKEQSFPNEKKKLQCPSPPTSSESFSNPLRIDEDWLRKANERELHSSASTNKNSDKTVPNKFIDKKKKPLHKYNNDINSLPTLNNKHDANFENNIPDHAKKLEELKKRIEEQKKFLKVTKHKEEQKKLLEDFLNNDSKFDWVNDDEEDEIVDKLNKIKV